MTISIPTRAAFTALITAFILHNIEEAVTICSYQVKNPFQTFQPASCKQFLVAVSLLSVAGLSAYIFAMKTRNQAIYYFISTGMAATLLLNVFLPHVLVAVYTFQYTPGIVSALILNLPLSILVLTKNRCQYESKSQFYRQILIFLFFCYLLFVISMGLAKFFV